MSVDVSELLVGHQPVRTLTPQDRKLFQAFQSNLLSLISHELRTPLMGVLNSLTLLEDAELPREQSIEFLSMAKRNAQRLQQALVTLLDLAAIESRNFHAKLREIDLARLVGARVEEAESKSAALRDRKARISAKLESPESPVVADTHKIARALDLCLDSAFSRIVAGSEVEVRIFSARQAPRSTGVEITFEMDPAAAKSFDDAWTLGVAGAESGVGMSTSAFAGVLQTEEEFLTRSEEGLGSELLLIHEIMRVHSGKFEREKNGKKTTLRLRFPVLTPRESLTAILGSRAYEHTDAATALALVAVQVTKSSELESSHGKVKALLYRTTDSAFMLPELGQVVVVMSEYPRKDMMKFLARVESQFAPNSVKISMVHFPDDVSDPTLLFDAAQKKLST